MATFNGFEPDETRTVTRRPRKRDKGHSIVAWITRRRGHEFVFIHTHVCQCGKRFSTRRDVASLAYRHEAHLRQEGVR